MRVQNLRYFFFIAALFFNDFFVSCSSVSTKDDALIHKILKTQTAHIPDSVSQLILAYNDDLENPQTKLFTLEKEKEEWNIVLGLVPAGIGKNGFARSGEKLEGDGKSPSGIFRLGHLFTYQDKVNTKMPFTQSTSEDKWIDDPESVDYNQHVRGETSAKSYENLKLNSDHYKYCMVIEYNTNPVVKGKGSAIFFHLRDSESEATAGCVAVSESDMLKILKWLDPVKYPMILMGNFDDLIKDDFHSAK